MFTKVKNDIEKSTSEIVESFKEASEAALVRSEVLGLMAEKRFEATEAKLDAVVAGQAALASQLGALAHILEELKRK